MGRIGITGDKVDIFKGPFDPNGQPQVSSPNQLWLGLFAWNVSGGCTISRSIMDRPATRKDIWEWPTASRLIQHADTMGLEFHLAAARWIGHGGQIGFHESVMEAMTAVPAAAAITKNILGLATGHVSYGFHPMHFAKMGATADQISGGRWGLNIVNGWIAEEQALFGQSFPDHELRYEMADEFITLVKHAWYADEPFVFDGKYFQSEGAFIDPKPIRNPRPFLVNAGSSPTGIDFAARQCDWLFCLGDLDTVARAATDLRDKAENYQRHVESFTFAWMLAADSNAEAQSVYSEVIENIDHEAAETFLLRGMQGSQSGRPVDETESAPGASVRSMVGDARYNATAVGLGGSHLVGDAEAIAEQIRQLHEQGQQRGIMLSFLDYEDGLIRLERDVLPILRKMGLRA